MNIPNDISQHLKDISRNGDLYAGILKGGSKEFLHHPFWGYDQITKSLALREEWDVEESMFPFYGDWHDLIAITQEGKEIPSSEPWEADKAQLLHSMDCVLHMSDNFLGIVNSQNQCLQFMVTKERSVTIDIPILKKGSFVGSKSKTISLSECLALVEGLTGDENFENLLPDETFIGDQPTHVEKKPWWKLW